MSAPDTPAEQLQPIAAPRKRKSIKSPVVKQAVIAHALLGATNLQIAKDLQIDRATVRNILSSTEINHHIEVGRSRAVSLIPRSLDVAEYRLSKNDGSMALGILRGCNVLQNQVLTANQTNIVANTWVMMRQQKQAELATTQEIAATAPDEDQQSDPPAK
jgi:hypothetical protein